MKAKEFLEKIKNLCQDDTIPKIKRRILNDKEAEFMADYFHNKEDRPDFDGFVGRYYYLPKEVMKIYNKKYGKDRGFF